MTDEEIESLIRCIINDGQRRSAEFRLFKKTLRKYMTPENYNSACEEYNKALQKHRGEVSVRNG